MHILQFLMLLPQSKAMLHSRIVRHGYGIKS
jgi:hypothetical protein